MHDLQSRASIIGSFFLSVLATQMSLVALTHLVLVFTQSAVVLNSFQTTKVKLVSGRVGGGDYYNYGTRIPIWVLFPLIWTLIYRLISNGTPSFCLSRPL
ncbi:hypothetical protein BASA81_017364 [Batrachochytrium salamandrivorans]|nr:hypothetical protein BASA81_017364 [Batrachochytrium salamandrivorans]